MRFQQGDKAIDQDARFAAARARRNDQIAIVNGDCVSLLGGVAQGRLPFCAMRRPGKNCITFVSSLKKGSRTLRFWK